MSLVNLNQFYSAFNKLKDLNLKESLNLIEDAYNTAETIQNIHSHPLAFKAKVFLKLFEHFIIARAYAQYAMYKQTRLNDNELLEASDSIFNFIECADIFKSLIDELSAYQKQFNDIDMLNHKNKSFLTDSEQALFIEAKHELFKKFVEFEGVWYENLEDIYLTNKLLFKNKGPSLFQKSHFRKQYKQLKTIGSQLIKKADYICDSEISSIREIKQLSNNIDSFNVIFKALMINVSLSQSNISNLPTVQKYA